MKFKSKSISHFLFFNVVTNKFYKYLNRLPLKKYSIKLKNQIEKKKKFNHSIEIINKKKLSTIIIKKIFPTILTLLFGFCKSSQTLDLSGNPNSDFF